MAFFCFAQENMERRAHPFAPKLSRAQAEEIRRLRRGGAQLAELAAKFGVAKSSISAIAHLHAHCPPTVVRVALPELERALLAEVAEDDDRADEDLASELLAAAIRHLPP